MIATAARSVAEISGYNSDAVQYRRGTSKNPTDEQLRNAKQIQRCSTAATYRPESENRWGGATSTAASRALSKASPPTLHLKGRIQVIVRIRPIEQTAARYPLVKESLIAEQRRHGGLDLWRTIRQILQLWVQDRYLQLELLRTIYSSDNRCSGIFGMKRRSTMQLQRHVQLFLVVSPPC